MFNTRFQLALLRDNGFRLLRTKGGHARYGYKKFHVDVPIHTREVSPNVRASIKRIIQRAQEYRAKLGLAT